MAKGKEKYHDSIAKVDNDQLYTSKVCDPLDRVIVKDYMSDEDDVSNETPTPEVIVKLVYEESKEYTKVLRNKGQHFMESNSIVYPMFKCTDEVVLPNRVFITSGKGDNVNPKLNKLVEEDNKDVTKDGFYSNQSTVENGLSKSSKTFQRQKPKRAWEVKNRKIEC